jgi:uncharacterized protein YlbG (UPF0298 family)
VIKEEDDNDVDEDDVHKMQREKMVKSIENCIAAFPI